MFLLPSTSHSVGAFFSVLTMLRWGVLPHMGQSSPFDSAGRESAKPQAAVRRRVRLDETLVLLRMGSSLGISGDKDVVVIDEGLERGDAGVAEEARGAAGVGERVFE